MKKIDMFDAPTGYIAVAKECLRADALCTGCAFNKIDGWGDKVCGAQWGNLLDTVRDKPRPSGGGGCQKCSVIFKEASPSLSSALSKKDLAWQAFMGYKSTAQTLHHHI